MDFLFYIGWFLLPFENFIFAPSAGWAAISPLVFFVYLIFNFKHLGSLISKTKGLVLLAIIVLFSTLINILFMTEYQVQAISRMISTLISLGLGFVSYFSFLIFFGKGEKRLKTIEKITLVSYSIVFFLGILQFLALRMNLTAIQVFFDLITKRNYLSIGRVQFFFTEPSFIGMHMWGILFPIFVYGKSKKIRNLMIVFLIGSVFFNCGVRIIFDSVVALFIIFLFHIDFKKGKNILIVLFSSLVLVLGVSFAYNNFYRVRVIVNDGVYADGSFASRWFRINASINGYLNDPLHALFGYGFGQEVIPLKNGYYEARDEYKNAFIREVLVLENAEKDDNESVSYCFYIRIISEGGFIIFLILSFGLANLYKKTDGKNWRACLLIILYLYVQFEPYAFYSIWLFLALNKYKNQVVDNALVLDGQLA